MLLSRSVARLLALSCCAALPAWSQTPPEPASAAASAAAPARPASAAAPARAASAPSATAPQRVEITGGRESDTDQRRRSTASKIIIGREEIDKFGDATVGEVLRRLPGVTTPGAPGRGGPPRLRGLGSGFTQLLIDGQRVPPGFSLESLTPEQVERIEILRAPTAETGARAIAGTINIVLREGYKRRVNDLRLGLGLETGRRAPSLGWTFNDSHERLIYNLSATAYASTRDNGGRVDTLATQLASGAVLRDNSASSQTHETRQGLNLSSRLQWRLGEAGDSLTLTPTLFKSQGGSDRRFTLLRRVSAPPLDPDANDRYDHGQTLGNSESMAARLNGQWRQRFGAWRLEMQGGMGRSQTHSDSLRHDYRQGIDVALRRVDESNDGRDRSANLAAKLSTLLGGSADGRGAHSLVAGVETEALRHTEIRRTLQDGLPILTDFGDKLQASSSRWAAYAQDEWAPDPRWALHAGLRWEGIATQGEAEGGHAPRNRSSVWTPLAHAVWKPDPARRDQVRLSLTRSYRAPPLASLIARPSLNQRAPAPGGNTPTTADSAGNPALLPELARGIDLAFERYLDGGGILSVNLFQRRIQNLMRRVLAQESVSWASVPRWVARQQNIGDASTQGIELEARFRLDQLLDGAPALQVKSNLSLFRSRVDNVPGPDNRLDQQPKGSANLGLDYRLRSLPLTLGGNLNLTPGTRTQLAEDQVVSAGPKRVVDVYGLWAFSPATALRVRAGNLLHADYLATHQIDALGVRTLSTTTAPTYLSWQLRLELKL